MGQRSKGAIAFDLQGANCLGIAGPRCIDSEDTWKLEAIAGGAEGRESGALDEELGAGGGGGGGKGIRPTEIEDEPPAGNRAVALARRRDALLRDPGSAFIGTSVSDDGLRCGRFFNFGEERREPTDPGITFFRCAFISSLLRLSRLALANESHLLFTFRHISESIYFQRR